ncbi:MAG: hypothetical protein AAF170_02350 [Bacteroidota bacterium]
MAPPRFLWLVIGLATLAACSVPPVAPPARSSLAPSPTVSSSTAWGPEGLCTDVYILTIDNKRTYYSLAAENVRNSDYCTAYPYLRWLLANDPLFTGQDPDDRNYLRMARVYEHFALAVDSSERRAWLDSVLAVRQQGREAMEAAGVAYESYARDLVQGFFYVTYAGVYPDAERRQHDAFTRAFEAQPDSLSDWTLGQLLVGSEIAFGSDRPNPDRAAFVEHLAGHLDDSATQASFRSFAEALRAPPPADTPLADEVLLQLVATFDAGEATCEQARQLLGVVVADPDRLIRADADPADLQTALLQDRCITDAIDDYETLAALAFQAFRRDDSEDGEPLFDRALAQAPSNTVRADLLTLRAQRQYGNPDALLELATRYDPTHGPSRFTQLRRLAQRVGQQTSLNGRYNYWCLADRFRQLAASTSDAELALSARELVPRYERSAPRLEDVFLEGLKPGDTVACSITGGTTRVR